MNNIWYKNQIILSSNYDLWLDENLPGDDEESTPEDEYYKKLDDKLKLDALLADRGEIYYGSS